MSFFSKIKEYFGYGPEDDDYEDSDETTNEAKSDYVAPAADKAGSDEPVVADKPEISKEMKARVFDHAVAVFNEALPDFLSRSVDPQEQSRRLAEALDKGLDEYLNDLLAQAEKHAESKLKVATQNALRESERLRSDVQQIEQQRATLREQQLSADRRYRALVERVAGLETQLATCEAEREQYQLENRSLLNKLKVADVQKNFAQTADGTPGVPVEEYEAEKAKAEQLEKELADLRAQQEMAQGMYNDLTNQYATERNARKEAESALEEARKIVDGVAEIQEQMARVDAVIKKRDERIERLKADNKKLREELAAAEAAAKHAIENTNQGLFGVSNESNDEKPADKPAESKFDAKTAAEMAAIEDEFECPDWFVSEPAPGEVSPLLQPDPEFGYQEPPRKPRKPENDAQLSLF